LRYDQDARRRRLLAEIIRFRMPMIAAGYASGCAATGCLVKSGADETDEADPRRNIG
jgi:hypothetical protein